jgi:8-oxo-dGTP pyrophosphatase MutT (NUDIX family)
MNIEQSIQNELDNYAQKYPREAVVNGLQLCLNNRVDLASRKNFGGHVTVGVLLLHPTTGTVLQVAHKTLDMWLFPGGHLEPKDCNLVAAALRELKEETGVEPEYETYTLLDIDKHKIPANDRRQEPEHLHFDFRFAFWVLDRPAVSLRTDEVKSYRWVSWSEIRSKRLRDKLTVGYDRGSHIIRPEQPTSYEHPAI